MEYDRLDDFLFQQGIGESFGGLIQKLQELPNESLFDLLSYVKDMFLSNLGEIRGDLLQLLGICLLFGVVYQLSVAFGREQIQQYGYYIYFVSGATICLQLFMEGYQSVYATVKLVLQFMELLLPTYSVAVIFSNGKNTSAAYYGMILLALFLGEVLIFSVFLPGSKIYMAAQYVNAGIGESMFSKFIKLFEDGFSWGLKIILASVCSLNMMQTLLFPALDKVRRLSAGKTVSMIPGVGTLAGSATELLFTTGSLLKNSIGIAAIIVLIALCAPSIIKLVVLILGVRILEAGVEPFFGQHLGGLLEGCYKSLQLVLKIQIHILTLFSLSLVILTAFS